MTWIHIPFTKNTPDVRQDVVSVVTAKLLEAQIRINKAVKSAQLFTTC